VRTVDYLNFFKDEKSQNFVKPQASFDPPPEFEIMRNTVRQRLEPPNIRESVISDAGLYLTTQTNEKEFA